MQKHQGGNNRRLAQTLGWLTKDRKIAVNIPEKDKSRFSVEKYKFFLDAPFEISNRCCGVMKKDPIHKYEKEHGMFGMTAQMAEESNLRTQVWLKQGCNAFDTKRPISNPMSFWVENDVLEYIYENDLPICSLYGKVVLADEQLTFDDIGFDTGNTERKTYKTTGCDRTGCSLCGFGCTHEKYPSRFELLKQTHPGVYGLLDKCKNNGVTFREAIEWTNEHGNLKIRL